MTETSKILQNLTVADFGLGLPAALAARLLGDAGATLHRFEPPTDPFYARHPAYELWQRGKTITRAENLSAALALAAPTLATADLCILGGEDFPGLAWHPDAEALSRTYPNLVILDLTGFPATSPDAATPAVDLLAQARSGLVFEQYSSRPICFALPAPSYGAALQGLAASFAALIARQRSGQGQIVRASLLEGALSWLGHLWFISERSDRSMDYITPKDVQPLIFKCADGRFIHFTLGTTNARLNVYTLLGIEDPTLAQDPRGLPSLARGVRNFYGDIDLLQSYIANWNSQELLTKLWSFGVPAEPVNNPGEAWDDPQTVHNGLILQEPDGARRVGLPFKLTPSLAPQAAPEPAPAAQDSPPLAGLRVIDFGNFTAGPHAAMVLADLGADVIKLEALTGDPIRGFYRPYATSSRGKRSLAIDMKKPEGLEIALRLIATAHIVQHNFRPGVMERLGLGAEALLARHPGLIFLDNSGYGATGPRAQSGGIDMVFQAIGGHERRAAGAGNPPTCYGVTTVDFAAGLLGALAILIAQWSKNRTGNGAAIETSLLNTCLFLLSELTQSPDGAFQTLPSLNATQTGFHPAEQLYQTADGWLAIAALGEPMARALVQTLGLDITAPPSAWSAPEAGLIAAAIAPQTTESLLAKLHAAGIWAAACNPNARDDILRSPALQASGTILSTPHEKYGEILQIGRLFSLSRSPTTPRGQTATLGQHSREILSELGYTEPQITQLFATATVA